MSLINLFLDYASFPREINNITNNTSTVNFNATQANPPCALPGTFHNYFHAAFRGHILQLVLHHIPCHVQQSASHLLRGPRHPETLSVPNSMTPSVTPKWPIPDPSEATPSATFGANLPHALDTGGTPLPISLPPRSPPPLSLEPRQGFAAPRGQARVPGVSCENRAARRRRPRSQSTSLRSDARCGSASGKGAARRLAQPSAVLLSAAARVQALAQRGGGGGGGQLAPPRALHSQEVSARGMGTGAGPPEGGTEGGGWRAALAAPGPALGALVASPAGRAARTRQLCKRAPPEQRTQQPAPGRPLASAAAAPGASHPQRPPAAPPPPGRGGEERERGGRARAWERVRGGARAPAPSTVWGWGVAGREREDRTVFSAKRLHKILRLWMMVLSSKEEFTFWQ
ncbi:uncharacterized protein [Tursiops truncatus]|uniref:uncharacterized protein n=1 Tax=Tursiops truncatus TaxID=9739 RepID=UPI003CCF15E4